MKSLFVMLALSISSIVSAQQSPTYLELNSPKSGIPCESDSSEREILLEKIEETTRLKSVLIVPMAVNLPLPKSSI